MIPNSLIPSSLFSAWASIAPAVGNHLWQSTLFAVAAGLLTLALRKNQARVRYWLWLAASAKFLIPFSLLVGMGSRLAGYSMGSKAGMYAAINQMGQMSQLFTEITGLMPAISTAQPAASHAALLTLLGLVWLCGLLVVLASWYVQWRRIAKVMREAKPLAGGREAVTLRRMEEIARMTRRIELLSSPASLEPGVIGIFRPVLLWPEGISRHLDDGQLEAVLAHEICHVQRRDNLTSAMHMLVEALFWFHPLVWWMEKRLVAEREHACDEGVLRLGRQPQIYAEGILKVCEFCVESPLSCVSGITGADLKKRIVRIMTGRVARNLDFSQKLLLIAAALIAIAAPIVFGQAKAGPSTAAQPAATTNNAIAFAVVSVKPIASHISRCAESGIYYLPDGIRISCVPLVFIMKQAYGIYEDNRISGAPDWIKSAYYDIDAKVDASDVAAFGKLARSQKNAMLQSLLEERFELKAHRQTKDLPIYALVVAKSGSKLKESKPDEPGTPMMRMKGRGEIEAKGSSLEFLLVLLSQSLGRPVVDKTGLTGHHYDFTLKWTPETMTNGAAPVDDSGPSLFTALEEQLGLKLAPARAPIECLVIDHIERPSAN